MEKVMSFERSTGMGALHCTQVFKGRPDMGWYPASELEGARRTGRLDGFERYEVMVPDGTITIEYHRSNSGIVRRRYGQLDSPRTDADNMTTDDLPWCAYCETPQPHEDALPPTGDDESWAELAKTHEGDCEWIATRAHNLPLP